MVSNLGKRTEPATFVTTARKSAFTHAVLMGDLIASEAAPSVRRLHAEFNKVIDDANESVTEKPASPLTVTLGDEFQGLFGTMSAALAVMRKMRVRLLEKKIECRFALGLVKIETALNQTRSWNMMGAGLAAAREKLGDKKQRNAYRFSIPGDPVTEELMDAVGLSITRVENAWSDRQLDLAIALYLDKTPNSRMPKKLGVVDRVYYKIKSAADIDFYDHQWRVLRNSVRDLDINRLRQ